MKAEKNAVGLDIGTSRIVSVKRVGEKDQTSAQLNAFVTLPYSKLTAGVFEKEGVPYVVEGDDLVVYGNEAARFANLFNREMRRPMTKGVLNAGEPGGAAMIRRLITSVLGEDGGHGSRICFSVPGAPADAPDDLTYHEKTLRQMLSSMGYEVSSINEGLAVVLAELESTNYTGVGVSFGGGMCNVCMAYLSVPVFSFSVSKAGDFIDSSAASVANESVTRIRTIKEQSFHFNGYFGDQAKQALAVYYDEVIRLVVAELKKAITETRQPASIGRPVPLVISGGSSLPSGFVDHFTASLNEAKPGIDFSEIRAAADPLNATAKGALVAALAGI
ncbi:MAG TPA: hypothetical protein VN442_01690 [Bryobacteraceae bacterium]|nr:hypothetical protein [Bryobacteraceae bacterium]